MKFYIDVFQTQKAGNAESEYEDAFWPPMQNTSPQENSVRIAVADGATDAVYSGLWARLLVRAYGRRRLASETIQAHLGRAARAWNRVVRRRPLPWYAEEKARAGAFAALVGLELIQLDGDSGGRWSALACGDSCFFHLRHDTLLKAFPISRSEDFSNAPLLLGSHGASSGLEGVCATTGDWQVGDCFYLMTDALATWFLARCERGAVPWRELRDVTLRKVPAFEEWISRLRRQREIKNDDCTLVSVSFEPCTDES